MVTMDYTVVSEIAKLEVRYSTVEPQSYRLHSYGKLGQLDTEIEYIFGKYHKKIYKMGTGHQV